MDSVGLLLQSPVSDVLTLARRFEPVLRYTQGELFFPMAVERYVEASALFRRVPNKKLPELVAPSAQLDMSTLITYAGERGASDLELHTDGPSYTNTTLDRLAAAGVDLKTVFFITGADAFRDLPSWRNYPAIAVSRPGCAAGALRQLLPGIASRMIDGRDAVPSHPAVILVDAPTAPVSSTDIRQRLASGRSIDGLVPPAVASYIERHGLYRTPHTKEPNGQS